MRSRTLRNFAKIADAIEVPDLIEVQLKGFDRFLQGDVAPESRLDIGLEALFREVFPIVSYDKTIELEYLGYELEKPRYTIEECKELRLSYPRTGYPIDNGLMSVTVITASSADADGLAKAIVLGLDEGMALIEKADGAEAIFITTEKDIYVTSGLTDTFHFEDTSNEYTYIQNGR